MDPMMVGGRGGPRAGRTRARWGGRPRRSVWAMLDAATSDLPEICGCDSAAGLMCPACALDGDVVGVGAA